LTKAGFYPDTALFRVRAMLEISISSVIVLAAAYWTALWLMGRREDVLHGQFVEGDPQPEEPMALSVGEQPPFRPELLQSLLTSIKRDLDQLARK
jgi:hypothetical protein